ncbi:MAG: flagellar export protein FliJ [Ruminococcaceae bacterium]|nr:flagellar export protein FliJ [Oscillospiraceae bacterium]
MKSFQFSLAKMRSYKEQVLEKEKTTLRQLQADKAKIETDIENLLNHRKMREEEFKGSKNGLMASELMLYKFHSENTRLQLNNLYEELRRAEARIDAQIKVVVSASQEVSGLDKLRDKQLEEYKYLEAKEMQEEILEMVAQKSTEEE